LSQSPSLRGSGRFAEVTPRDTLWAALSQSPSLRGSGRFGGEDRTMEETEESLNPLHCGAVVASVAATTAVWRAWQVSIPFIAGQWSLHGVKLALAWQVPVSIPFIAGQWSLPLRRRGRCAARPRVSIPFIAGQWSLRVRGVRGVRRVAVSQSPSLRGSGRFLYLCLIAHHQLTCLNPLHCGAVVASQRIFPPSCGGARLNPLHCGAVVASREGPRGRLPRHESQSPSLRGSGRFGTARSGTGTARSLNPLHCGAVVASGHSGRRKRGKPQSLNPLHCGAVVASKK